MAQPTSLTRIPLVSHSRISHRYLSWDVPPHIIHCISHPGPGREPGQGLTFALHPYPTLNPLSPSRTPAPRTLSHFLHIHISCRRLPSRGLYARRGSSLFLLSASRHTLYERAKPKPPSPPPSSISSSPPKETKLSTPL